MKEGQEKRGFLEECVGKAVVSDLQPSGPVETVLNSLGKIRKHSS